MGMSASPWPLRRVGLIALLGVLGLGAPSKHALGWGHTGHVEISRLAVQKLPQDVPAFVRPAAHAIGEFGAEADLSTTADVVTAVGEDGRISTARTAHDAERDPGHYIDVDDQGLAWAVP